MVSTAPVNSLMPAFSASQSPVESGTGIPPLSPPADQMELDFRCHSSSLQNGHALKDDSFVRDATFINNSSPHRVDETRVSQSNGATNLHDISTSVEAPTDHLSNIPNGEDLTSVSPKPALSQPSPSDTDLAPVGPDYDIAPAITQAPTSSVREETPPSSIEPSLDLRKELDPPRNVMQDSALAQDIAEEVADLMKDPTTPTNDSVEDSDKMNTLAPDVEQTAIRTTEIPHHPPVPTLEGALPEAPVAPATSPAAVYLQNLSADYSMPDAPRSPGKVAREREDEEVEDGPAAKRSRMDDDGSAVPEFKVPELPEALAVAGSPSEKSEAQPNVEDEQPVTKAQQKYLARSIQILRKTDVAKNFKDPVDPVALKIPTYFDHIKNPMDLKTMEGKLKNDQYPSINAFVADFNLILYNCLVFNGPGHAVTKNGNDLRLVFEKQMSTLPGPDVVDPPPADKKKKTPLPAIKPPPSRRESRSSLPGSARSPAALESPQVFALGPEGVPLIRRDSTTVGDGRPKREIHRPPPRDLPYANQKPKKKKYQMELRFCQEVINELNKPKYAMLASPFKQPVDPVALNIPTYHSIIKKPMDLGTIAEKLRSGQYENAKEFEADVHLVFQNCYKFNPPTDPVHNMGKELETIFNDEWKKMRRWIEERAPGSGPQTPSDSEDDDEEDDDEEDEEEDDDKQRIANLQEQMAKIAKDLELIGKSKKASPPAIAKKASKGSKSTKKDSKKGAPVIPAKVDKKPTPKAAKREKVQYVTYEQKQDISNRINSLPENRMATALKIIRDNMPTLKGIQDDELELDIDELSNEVLQKLYQFVLKYAPRPEDPPTQRSAAAASQNAAPSRPKKNKPMSKHEQEAQIAQVKGKLSAFQHPGYDEAPDNNANAAANDTSGDEDDSEESEEE